MGTWGNRILQDDLTQDIVDSFKDCLKKGLTIEQSSEFILKEFADSLDDKDESSLVWLALSELQWRYDKVQKEVLSRVQEIIKDRHGLTRWAEVSDKDYQNRLRILESHLEKIEKTNPKPSKLPKTIIRKPPFSVGDCLCVKLYNGKYGAAYVLAANHSNVELGMNLVGMLDYSSNVKPSLSIFRKRRWLKFTHLNGKGQRDIVWYLPIGFRKNKNRFDIIGNLNRRLLDPEDSKLYCGWNLLGGRIPLQKK